MPELLQLWEVSPVKVVWKTSAAPSKMQDQIFLVLMLKFQKSSRNLFSKSLGGIPEQNHGMAEVGKILNPIPTSAGTPSTSSGCPKSIPHLEISRNVSNTEPWTKISTYTSFLHL